MHTDEQTNKHSRRISSILASLLGNILIQFTEEWIPTPDSGETFRHVSHVLRHWHTMITKSCTLSRNKLSSMLMFDA